MLIACLAAAILFLFFLWAFVAFDNAMLKEERAAMLERAQAAEAQHARAIAGRVRAEQSALSAHAATVEAQDKIGRLSLHVRTLMSERSQLQSLQLPTRRVFDLPKSRAQTEATRSAHLN